MIRLFRYVHYTMRARLFVFAACLAGVLCMAQPRVANRPAQAREAGYRPADRESVELNPPSLTWVAENGAASYQVQWSKTPDFKTAYSATGLRFNCYTHDKVLSPGAWYWRYSYTTAKGQVSDWSTVRQFEIPGGAVPFPLPSEAERKRLMPSGHPRLFVRPETLPGLRAAAAGEYKEKFSVLRAQADKLVGARLVPEPREPGTATVKTDMTLLRNWWKNREQTMQACTEAETVAFVYMLTGEQKYGKEARRRLMALAAWDPAAETNFRRNCEAAKPLLHRIARVYDWAYPMLSATDRKTVQAVVQRRIRDAWVSGEVGNGVGAINSPRNSHGNRTFHKIGESAIVFFGEIPEAGLWLDFALNKFYAVYPVWSDSDGGWHEGLNYWAGYMSKIVWWLHAMDVALKIDGFKKPFFSHVGDFGLYVAPPGSPNQGFGDLSHRPPSGWGHFLDYFTRETANRAPNSVYWQWWGEQWNMKSGGGILGFLYEATLPKPPAPRAPTDLPTSKLFRGTGIASMHTTLLDSADDVHFLFKCSPFGSMSHGFNPQNSFQLNAYGECLLPACVYRDWYGTGFHYKWVHETVSQNAVLVDRQGQIPHGPSPGRMVAEEHGEGWDYFCGDAAMAYGGRLKRSLRHVLFIKPDIIVLFDELEAPEPSTFQFMLHGFSEFRVDSDAQTLSLQQPKAGLLVRYMAEQPLKFKQWDGFNPAPLRGEFPNQWHVEASTVATERTAENITLLFPYKGTSAPTVKARRRDTPQATVLEIELNGKKTRAGFRKAGAPASIEAASLKIEGPVSVLRP